MILHQLDRVLMLTFALLFYFNLNLHVYVYIEPSIFCSLTGADNPTIELCTQIIQRYETTPQGKEEVLTE